MGFSLTSHMCKIGINPHASNKM